MERRSIEKRKKTIGVLLIGGGFMGKTHSNAWLKVAKFFRLPVEPVMACLCRRDTSALGPMAERWGWQATESDWRKAICRDDVDLVDITTPNDLHRDMAVAAAKAAQFKPDFADALEVQKVLDAVIASAKERRWVKLSEIK